MAKVVHANPFFHKCQWTAEEINSLLDPIEVHVNIVSAICNHCKEALTLISRKWSVDAEEYIRCQGLVERSFKLTASVPNRRNVPNLKIGLFLANTQIVR